MKKRVFVAIAGVACCFIFSNSLLAADTKYELKSDRITLAPGESAKFTLNKDRAKVEFAGDETYKLVPDPLEGLTCPPKSNTCTAPKEPGKGLATIGNVVVNMFHMTEQVASFKITLTEEGSSFDDREDFEATFYTGASIDSFAAQDLNNYLNPGDSATKKLGYVAGIDFAYRFFGDKNDSKKWQLWVYGETVHGQRSAEVDCAPKEDKTLPDQCGLDGFLPKPGAFLGILRNASSLEAFTGVRLEMFTLHARGNNAAKIYVKSELGFFSVSGAGGDVLDSHQKIAIGALATGKGRYKDSFLETAWGKSDVFKVHPGRRFKMDGYLTWDLDKWMSHHGMKPFIEITLDSDFGRGADSVRTYYGFNFDLRHLTKPTTD
jgi:hypothetical protein